MPINTKSINASGLTAAESKALQPRQPSGDEGSLLKRLAQLYSSSSSQVSEDTYAMFTKDSLFHDPVGIAEGQGKIREQFNGLVKLFDHSTVDKQVLLTNPPTVPATSLLVDQTVSYYTKSETEQKEPIKTINSLIRMDRNSEGLVTKLTEEWDHQGEKDSSDGFFGTLSEWRKKATATLSGKFVDQDPSKV